MQGGLYSTRELSSKRAEYSKQIGATSQKPRHENFGWEGSAPGAKVCYLPSTKLAALTNLSQQSSKATRNRNVQQVLNQYNTNSAFSNFASNSSALPPPQLQEMALMQGYAPHQARGGLFGGAPQAAAAFGVPSQQSGLFGAAPAGLKRAAPSGFHADESVEEDDDEDMGFGLFGEPANKPLVFEEGAWEESGMTTVSLFSCNLLHIQLLSVAYLAKAYANAFRLTTFPASRLLLRQTQLSSTRLQRLNSVMWSSPTSSSANYVRSPFSKLVFVTPRKSRYSKDHLDSPSTARSWVKPPFLVFLQAKAFRCHLGLTPRSMWPIPNRPCNEASQVFSARRTVTFLLAA